MTSRCFRGWKDLWWWGRAPWPCFLDLVGSGPWDHCADVRWSMIGDLVFYSSVFLRSSQGLSLSALQYRHSMADVMALDLVSSHKVEKNLSSFLTTQKLRRRQFLLCLSLPHSATILSLWPSILASIGGYVLQGDLFPEFQLESEAKPISLSI